MKLKEVFLTQEIAGQQVMVSSNTEVFSGIVHSNKTAADIIDCLKTDTTREEVIEKMLDKYDVSYDVIARDVDEILTQLESIGALE